MITLAIGLRQLERFFRREHGTQLVELALVLPILLLFFAATAEFGRFFYTYTTLAKATRAGARHLVAEPVSSAEDTRAQNLVVYGNSEGTGSPVISGLSPQNVKITRTGGVPKLPQRVSVQIDGLRYQPLFDLGKLTGSKSLSLMVDVSPSTTMRYLLTQPTI